MDEDITPSSPLSVLLRSETSSLPQVQYLVEANPELLNLRFPGSAVLISIQEECSDEVILYLLSVTFGRDNVVTYHELNNDEKNTENSGIWKVLLVAALDERRHISRTVIWQLFKTFPQWIDCHTFYGMPIGGHLFSWVLAFRPDLVSEMIQRYPRLAVPQGNVGYTPLHIAARQQNRTSMEVLIEAFPAGLEVKDSFGLLPLHYLVMSGSHVDLDLFNALADRMPASFFRDADVESRRLFLHEVMFHCERFTIDDQIIQAILDRNPEAAMVADVNGCLPIHLLLDSDDEAYPVIERLINTAPESLLVAEQAHSHIPLHWAVSKFMVHSAQDMIQHCPQGILCQDRNGQTPLHTMLDSDMFNMSIAKCMVQLYPQILLMRDVRGKVPLHYAVDECEYFEDIDWFEAVELLVRTCPQAGLEMDHNGKTPLHYAVARGTPQCVLQTLITSCAPTLWIPDLDGNIPLFHAARAVYQNPYHCSLSTLYLLARHEPANLVSLFEHSMKANARDPTPSQVFARKRKHEDV